MRGSLILMFAFGLFFALAPFAFAQGELEQIATYFGLDITSLLAVAGTIIMLANLVKEWFKVQGNWNIAVVAGLSGAYSIFTYQNTVDKIIVSTILLTILAAAAWKTAKIVAHKAATPEEPSK
jgi:4-amino-4-deoxy-L-arabinose transferase-like glycosyltransferase